MLLRNLNLLNFKNYNEARLDFDSRVNCFIGDNGEGKTNILDAIHYLSFCKSYFNPIDIQNINHNEEFFVIEGEFEIGDKKDKIFCGLKKGQKKSFRRNKKEYGRLADHIGHYPAVMISPYDQDLISEGSEIRRKFIDSIISQYNRVYLDDLIQYNKVLQQRNRLLKYFFENRTFDADSLEVWDEQLSELAGRIHKVRQEFISGFLPVFDRFYERISGRKEIVSIEYRSHLNEGNFKELLNEYLKKDRRSSYSNVGVHKDDLVFTINGHPLKKFGSQGQQKSFLIALKLAQFELIKSIKDVVPVLLLDDIFDKIDDKRVKHLMELVSENSFGQIFITDTHSERVPDIFRQIKIEPRIFLVENGGVIQ